MTPTLFVITLITLVLLVTLISKDNHAWAAADGYIRVEV